MIEKICNRCLESKPIDQFSTGAYRCHPCRAEANKLNVAHHRDLKREIEGNRRFSELMRGWMPGGLTNE